MKVLGISGSARKDGNTAFMIKRVFEALGAHGIETELTQENSKLYGFELTADEMARINALDRNEKHDWY